MKTAPEHTQALDEIKAVLRKHDLAGLIIITGPAAVPSDLPDITSFLCEVSPTWSCARIDETPQGTAIRIRSLRADYPSLEAQKECMQRTASMIFGFHHQSQRNQEAMMQLLALLARAFPDIRNTIQEML